MECLFCNLKTLMECEFDCLLHLQCGGTTIKINLSLFVNLFHNNDSNQTCISYAARCYTTCCGELCLELT
jgi:hypothetical protein